MDITKCAGDDRSGICPKRANCLRFTARDNEGRQAYFVRLPLRQNGTCEQFTPTTKEVF